MFYPDPNSIVDYLKSQGQPSDMESRKALAASYGIVGYTGTAAQNVQLLALVKGSPRLWERLKQLFTR